MTGTSITAGPPGARDAGVVLIHALGRTHWSMWLMARRLRAAGWAVVAVGYPSLELPIEQSSGQVAEMVAEASRGWRGVHLVGHSLGGIIARRLKLTRPDLRIRRVVQIGSPNLGTAVSGELARQKFAHKVVGPVLAEVAAFPSRVERHDDIGSIAGTWHCRGLNKPLGHTGPNDGLVTVRSAWGGAGARAIVPVSHSFMPYSARAAGLVNRFLRNGNFGGARGARR